VWYRIKGESMAKVSKKAPAKAAQAKAPVKTSNNKPVREYRADGLAKDSAAALLVDTVCRPKGATNAELCETVGWAQCMPYVKSSAAKAGVVIRTEKVDGVMRYFGTRKASKAKAA
jgi:hypothetical protein